MLGYRFYLRNNQNPIPAFIEIDEPIGWDGVVFTLQRSDQFEGLENLYSDDLTFYGTGTDILRDAFELFGFDAQVDFKIEYYCEDTLNSTDITVINMLTYKRAGNETTVKLERSSFDRKFKNRFETKVNFGEALSIEGTELTPLGPFDLKLHSKLIQTGAIFKELGTEIIWTATNGLLPALYKESGDLADTNDVTSYNSADRASNYFVVNNSSFIRNIQINAHIELTSYQEVTKNPDGVATTYKFTGGYKLFYNIYLADGTTLYQQIQIADIPYTDSLSPGTDIIDFNYTITLFPTMRAVFFLFEYHENDLPGTEILSRSLHYIFQPDTNFTALEQSKVSSSSSKAYIIYEAFNRICESITDTPNAFRSDFFGRLDSVPENYPAVGCGAWTAITNGLNLRKMKDKDGNFFPFISSFLDLYRSVNAIWNLGARVEEDGSGGYYIRVEPKEYFYNNRDQILTLDSPGNIEVTVAIDKLYNDIEIGYEKWQIEEINGIDEFNSKRFYSIPLLNVKNKLQQGGGNMLSPYIAGGYAIEMTRRVQYSANPTTDFQYDNDNFIICLNRTEVTSDEYSFPPVSQSYGPGEVSERDENYTSVDKLISPETAYNLRISPVNMMFNWWKSLSPALLLKPNKVLKYQSGEGNTQMITLRDDACSESAGAITENQDIRPEDLKSSDIRLSALFNPVYISFDYPIHFGNFITVKNESNKLIRVNCGDVTYFGFIKELKFAPNNGSASFKILLANCVGGGFDSGFDNGFEIGTC